MKKKNEPAAAAAKAELPQPVPDKPYELQPGPGRPAPAPIMSANLGIRHDEPRITPPVRGPQAGEANMPDQAFVEAFATAEELARFRKEIVERRARDIGWAWERCDRCGLTLRVKPTSPEGDCCVKCNRMRTTTGGHFKRMDTAAVDAFLYAEALREKAGLERDRRAQFNRTNTRRGEQGLGPISYEAFTKLQRDEFEALKARGRALGQIGALCRRQP